MTRRDATFPGTVIATIWSRRSLPKPSSMAARAASVAYSFPQYGRNRCDDLLVRDADIDNPSDRRSRHRAARAQSDFGGNSRIDRAPFWRCLRDIHVCDATLKLLLMDSKSLSRDAQSTGLPAAYEGACGRPPQF